MQLIPVFRIGILNAWIFVACYLLLSYSLMLINKEASKRLGNPPDMKLTKKEKVLGNISNIIIYIVFLYTIFLPFKLETAWFYLGLPIFILGLSILTITIINFLTTPLNQPVTKGIYHYSRHPGYISIFLVLIGIGIATASWIILLVVIIFLILANIVVNSEERYCKEKYGDTYKEYLNRTPRWIGIPKS
jgi:protein-S-isoprenylcysteine O-methyltransferase Ste14